LDIPYVVISDGDPFVKNEKIYYRGIIRAINLCEIEDAAQALILKEMVKQGKWSNASLELRESGVFIGQKTLELDLISFNNTNEMVATLQELGAGERRIDKFKKLLANSKDNEPDILQMINAYGKGRFAQRLSPKLKKSNAPDYIKTAINHIVRLVNT
jgi:putative ATP-dependent endonuclease of OLD family